MNSAHSSPSESDLSYPSPPSSPTLHILAPRFRPLARPLRFIDQASVPTPIGFVDNAGAMFATISVEEAEEGEDADLDEEGDPQTEGVDSVASDVDNGPTSSQRSTITIETNPETDDSDYSDDDLSSELSDVPPELPSPLKSHEPASAIDEDEEDELLDDDEPTDHPAGGKAVVAEPVEHVELQHASQREHGTPNSHILRGAEVAAFLPRTPSPKHVFRRASDVSPHCNPLARLLVPSQRAHDSNAASVPWAMPIGSSSSEQATSGLSPADPTSTLVAGPTTSLHDPAADTGPKSLTSACSASAAPSSRVDEDSTRAGERLSTVPSTSVTSSPGFDVVGQHVAADDPEPASKKRR
ncbi:unnamed protein product, partial [Tilletia controversa]